MPLLFGERLFVHVFEGKWNAQWGTSILAPCIWGTFVCPVESISKRTLYDDSVTFMDMDAWM